MSNRTRIGTCGRAVAFAALLVAVGPAREARAAEVCAVPAATANDLGISAGRDATRAWVTGDRGALRVQKFSAPDGESVLEIRYHDDRVIVQVAPGASVQVTHGRESIAVDSPQALDRLQTLLGGSRAIYHARALLSDYEQRSTLRAPEMSLLAGLAFVASLTGDVGAPLRLTDRFMFRHRGVLRQVAMVDEESCWSEYSREVNDAWNDLQACMDEAGDGIMGSVRRLACNAVWLLRADSAWFEYMQCLSPLTVIDKLE